MRSLLVLPVLAVLFAANLSAQTLQARFVSSGYAWQRQDTVGQSTNHLFGYQSVQLSIAGENLSFHTYAQGFTDFSGPFKNEGQYRLYNLYFKYANLFDVLSLSVGRQAVFAGAGNGTIDGGLASVKLFDAKVKLLGYYGTLPPPRQKVEMIGDRKNNFMTGGQLVASPIEFAQLGLSFMNRKIASEPYMALRRDSLFNPYVVEIKPMAASERTISGDASVDYDIVSAYGRYDYDLETEKSARMQLFTRVKILPSLGVTGEYIQREPRLSYNSIFSVFTFNTLKEYELGVEYALSSNYQVYAKYGSVSYGDDDSQRITLGASGKHGSVSLARNVGYAGELSAASLNFGYPLFDNQITPTVLVSYAKYKLSESASTLDASLSAAVGAVYRPLRVLSFDAQVQWIQNTIYKNDVRLFLRGSYLLSQRLDIF
ncbi:MAG TPA: hypothetical protein DCP63_12625 [Bacteroidetes bacterium]|nr:hypothetical protein [Bacteroidota bacterium]